MPQPNSGRLVIRCEEKHPRYINDQEIPNWQQGPSVWEAVNYLTQNGWLLFSDHSTLRLGYGELTFIDPKQYLYIWFEENHPRYINGKEIPNWQQGPSVSEAVLYLLQLGWLVLSDHSDFQLGYGDLTLIRSKQ